MTPRFLHALIGAVAICTGLTLAMPGLSHAADAVVETQAPPDAPANYQSDVSFTLHTAIADGKLVFVGASKGIQGQVNPDLRVPANAVVQISLVNGDGAIHDIAVPEFSALSEHVAGKDAATTIVFRANKDGQFEYFCTLPGHKAAGMVGKLIVGEPTQAPASKGVSIARDPADVGTPVGKRGPRHLTVDLKAVELTGRLDDGSSYRFWTFNRTVPGPFIRARVDDRITINLANDPDSKHIHSIDLHAVTGPGGGAAVTQVSPGQKKSFTFKALSPGLYVYHCATPMVAQHISNGMYGMILVEPEGGLSPVDREYYVMQGELYTAQTHGTSGEHEFSLDKLLAEAPTHLAFNGSMDALTKEHPLHAKVGEKVRIFFGNGGPNLTSSLHMIGEIFDHVYREGDLVSPPARGIQTTLVPAAGSVMAELTTEVPGRYILVDHSLSRMEKGLAGYLEVEGKDAPHIFHSTEKPDPESGH